MEIFALLTLAVEAGASDLHLSAGLPPALRIDGNLRFLDQPILAHQALMDRLNQILNEQQRSNYQQNKEIDFTFALDNTTRFRTHIYRQERGAAAAFRIIPTRLSTMNDLNLPPIFKEIAALTQGLVLITGPTGSGKSTTLAAIIDHINTERTLHIVTMEDPVEFIHSSKKSLISQREISRDTQNFNSALRSALREDPDVIMAGELRDTETIRLAVTAAETGHLVFATLHTSSAAKTINRLLDGFPANQQGMIRSMLSESLQAVIAQKLLPRRGGGRLAIFEIMICNSAIRNLIRENKTAQIYSAIQTGASHGMQTYEQHLKKLKELF